MTEGGSLTCPVPNPGQRAGDSPRTLAGPPASSDPASELARPQLAQRQVLDGLTDLAADSRATVEARAAAEWGLRSIQSIVDGQGAGGTPEQQAHVTMAAADIQRFLDRRYEGGARTEALPSEAQAGA